MKVAVHGKAVQIWYDYGPLLTGKPSAPLGMKRVKIDCEKLHDWDSFHDIFSDKFGFPDFYGRNLGAWMDCMSYLDDPNSGMTKITCDKGEYILLELQNIQKFRKKYPDLYEAIIECSAFVNWRSLENGQFPLLMLSFYK